MSQPSPIRIRVAVDQIRFDPNDDTTQKFRPGTVVYQIYLDTEYQGTIDNNQPALDLELSLDFLFRNGDVRIIAKDTMACIAKPGTAVDSDLDARVGTISVKATMFQEAANNPSATYKQWITLFDEVDDDEFDGEFGVDDEEMPMILTAFELNPKDVVSAVKPKSPTPRNESVPTLQAPTTNMPATTKNKPNGLRSRGSMRSPNLVGNEHSPNRVVPKRKTVITESGSKVVVNKDSSGSPRLLGSRVAEPANYEARRAKKKARASDVFGDFYGFGSNPPGCMSKGTDPIDIKKEKERFLGLLTAETKRYDVQGMYQSLKGKTEQIVKGIRKDQKIIMNDEERTLRNLDKLGYMHQYLKEDHDNTQASLAGAAAIRDESKAEMHEFGVKNNKELSALDNHLNSLQNQIGDADKQKVTINGENDRLQLEINDGRQNDTNVNAGLVDKIKRTDGDFDRLEKELARNIIPGRQQKLSVFNNECEKYNTDTQRTENQLKERETERQRAQEECEKSEKGVMQKRQECLGEESQYYDLQYRSNYVSAEIEHKKARYKMLVDRANMLVTSLTKQLQAQADEAAQNELETRKLKADLDRQRDTVKSQTAELSRLEDSNANIKKQKYEQQVDQLYHQIDQINHKRSEMQTKLETLHNKWTCKIGIYVTDMTEQSQQSKSELAQIEKLLQSMQTIGLKQADQLQHRQQLLQDNFESAEKSELTTHLQTQIQDCDQMIADTQVQITQIKEQVDKIVKAHEDRKEVIKDQIQELNIIRSQKVDLDKQISLQSSQIMDLNRHITRLDSDIDRLQLDKEQLVERLEELSAAVHTKIEQIESVEGTLQDKDKIIEIMNRRIRDKQRVHKTPIFNVPKGDALDQMLTSYINAANCPVPLRKIGGGQYWFGTKKIYAKILNGKLVIRVGGGYMIIEEFVATYADNELKRMQNMTDDQLQNLWSNSKDVIAHVDLNQQLTMHRTLGQVSSVKTNSAISGTSRVPKKAY